MLGPGLSRPAAGLRERDKMVLPNDLRTCRSRPILVWRFRIQPEAQEREGAVVAVIRPIQQMRDLGVVQ